MNLKALWPAPLGPTALMASRSSQGADHLLAVG
jgi:hypothetical protein